MKKEFAVIGLGRFGGSIVRELIKQGANVLAIDKDAERADDFMDIATQVAIADTTDEAVLKSLGVRNFDHVIVAIGENIQSSILTTIMLKEIGVDKITVKAQNDYHAKVLTKIGADKVVHPERDMGIRIAHNALSNNVLDYLELSDEYSIMEIQATKKLGGYSLTELDIRAKFGLNIVAIRRGGEIIVSPQADFSIHHEDILVLIGSDKDISRFEKRIIN